MAIVTIVSHMHESIPNQLRITYVPVHIPHCRGNGLVSGVVYLG